MNGAKADRFKVALLVPDGVGIRNFVLGHFLENVVEQAEVHIFHVIPDELLDSYRKDTPPSVHWHSLIPYQQTRPARALQDSLGYAHMYWTNTVSMRRALGKPITGPLRTRAFVRATRLLGRGAARPESMNVLDALHCSLVRKAPETGYYSKMFNQIKPDVLFCSHQRPTSILPAVIAATDLGIPTSSFIFSWDNLSSKSRIVAPFQHFLVWSPHMAAELRRFYPSVDPKNIHIVGTPQFDPYADEQLLWTREEFFARVGADPRRPLICYSGGDTGNCPEDPNHVRVLLTLIRSGRIKNNPQVLVRPSPVNNGTRYQPVREAFPELLFAQPQWIHTEPGNWARVIPTRHDIRFLANLTAHCDINVNFGSTMTLDFGIHDKPVVNTAFDVTNPPIFGMPIWDYFYRDDHIQPVLQLKASRVARSVDEFAEHINGYLQEPSLDREGRRKLFELQVGVPLGRSGSVITETLQRIASMAN